MLNWFRRLLLDDSAQSPASGAHPGTTSATAIDAAPPQACASPSPVPWRHRDQVDYLFSGWLFEMENHPEVFTNGNEDAILAALDETVKSDQSGAHMVRRMPGVIPQLLQALRNSDFSGAEVARTISTDVVLVAEVLRRANSAGCGNGSTVTGIDHAILLLGHDGLRQLITGVAFKPIIDMRSGSFTRMVAPRLWTQSERCALACGMLARDLPVDPLEAFLAGLVHNVGVTVSLRVIDRMADGRQPVGSPTFCNALAAMGLTLASNIASEWHFPDTVVTAIREQGADPRDKGISALGRILQMGDYLSKMDILVRRGRMEINLRAIGGIGDDLSAREIDCLAQLAAAQERDWQMPAARNAGPG